MTPAVLVIGDIIHDVIVSPKSVVELGTDTPAHIEYAAGGSGANQAAWLARCGVPTMLAGRLGISDERTVSTELRTHGVEPLLAVDRTTRTGTIVTLVDPDGERSFLTDRGASANLCADDLPFTILDRVQLLHISSYSLLADVSRTAILDFAAEAMRRNIPVSYDPNSVSLLRELGIAQYLEWTRGASMLFPNTAEAAMLTGTYDPKRQNDMFAKTYALTIIKRGAGGADLVAGDLRLHVDAEPIDAVDTTGAGDAFAATYIAGYLAGEEPATCLARAVKAGTLAASQFGGRPR